MTPKSPPHERELKEPIGKRVPKCPHVPLTRLRNDRAYYFSPWRHLSRSASQSSFSSSHVSRSLSQLSFAASACCARSRQLRRASSLPSLSTSALHALYDAFSAISVITTATPWLAYFMLAIVAHGRRIGKRPPGTPRWARLGSHNRNEECFSSSLGSVSRCSTGADQEAREPSDPTSASQVNAYESRRGDGQKPAFFLAFSRFSPRRGRFVVGIRGPFGGGRA
jgi:hypothetical protein